MTDDDPERSGSEPPKPFPLPYGRPARRPGLRTGYRFAIGCFGYILLSVLWYFGAIYFSPTMRRLGIPESVVLRGWLLMTLGLLGITLWLRVRLGYEGYGYGVLTGIVVTVVSAVLLILGLILLLIKTCGHR
jgi:hypothetical protein